MVRNSEEHNFTIEEVQQIVYEMGDTKAPGIDDLTAPITKTVFELVGEQLCKLFNACLTVILFWLLEKDKSGMAF